jgi:beta-lactamase regulating signal transducer with metallopeptidase domain
MSLLLEIAAKSAVIFLVALLTTTALRGYSAALRHFVLAVAFLCVAAVPVLTWWAPEWRLPVPASWLGVEAGTPVRFAQRTDAANDVTLSPSVPQRVPARNGVSPLQLASGIWLAGALLALASTGAGMWRVSRFARGARLLHRGTWRAHADEVAVLCGIRRPVHLLQSAHPTMLVTWGLMRPRILLPVDAPGWSADRIRIVLYHELAHVGRCDWAILIAARVVRALLWFNPLAWIAFRRLREESERACDDTVLGRGVSAPDYASHLLAVAREAVRHRTWSAATAIAQPSTLEGRVRAMLNERLDRTPLTARARWTATLASLGMALAVAGAGLSVLAAPVDARATAAAAQPSGHTRSAPTAHVELSGATVVVGASRVSAARVVVEAPPAAQAAPGTIRGVLYDQLGGLLPGAQVRLVHQLDGAKYDTTTDRDGAFLFTALPPGDYELNTSLIGFATVSNLIKVGAGDTIERAVTLPIGTLEETINVTGANRALPQTTGGTQRGVRPRSSPEPRTFFSGGIGGQIRAPLKTLHVSPRYPADASGSDVVFLTARVGIDGFLSDLREVAPEITSVRAQASHAAFVASALDAVRQWEFTPVLLNNVPVEANITIRVYYSAP